MAGPTITLAGSGALLLDAATGPFSGIVQRRIWAAGTAAQQIAGVDEVVPGMNNLLVAFDPLAIRPSALRESLRQVWDTVEPGEIVGKRIDVPVVYGGSGGADLAAWAAHCGLAVEEAVRRHAAATYSVAAIGAMPGFPYLSGLDPSLACPRRASPRALVPIGAVIVGGAQAAIMPQTAPSGWHILGHTQLTLFDPAADPPCMLQPGDSLRFVIAGIEG